MIDPKERVRVFNPGTMQKILIELQRRNELADLIIQYANAKRPIPIKLINEYNELTRVEVQE